MQKDDSIDIGFEILGVKKSESHSKRARVERSAHMTINTVLLD